MVPRGILLAGVLLMVASNPRSCYAWVSPAARINHDRVKACTFTSTRLHAKSAKKKKPKTKRNSDASSGGGFATSSSSENKTPHMPNSSMEAQDDQKIGLESNQQHKDSMNIVQLSSRPPIFTIDNFLDPKICSYAITSQEALNEVGVLLQQQIMARLFHNQTSVMDGLRYNTASYSAPNDGDNNNNNSSSIFPDGLHMDTNNECSFRHVTCILYLNDVQHGGATVFPLAETSTTPPSDHSEKLVAASRRLLDAKIGHTRSCGTVRRSGSIRQADGDLLEHCADDPSMVSGIKVQPKAGRLLVFFSRTTTGEEDVRAWHGGERILEGDKHILTLFKQVDYGPVANHPDQAETTFEGFLAPQVTEHLSWFNTASAKC